MAKSIAKSLAQLLHLEDTHKWMLVKDSVDEGGEGGGVADEARALDEARVLVDVGRVLGVADQARAEVEATNPGLHHQASLLQEASQAVLHHVGEEHEEVEATQTAGTSLRTFRVSPQPRWWPTSNNILAMCAWSSTARTARPCCEQNCPVPP